MHNLIERPFCRLKDWRAIATRYDKTARNLLAGICMDYLERISISPGHIRMS